MKMEVKRVKKASIRLPKEPLRRQMDDDFLTELRGSVKKLGFIHEIVIRPVGDGYGLVAGGQRLAVAPGDEVEAKVINLSGHYLVKDLGLAEELAVDILSIAENYQRSDVPWQDLARKVDHLHEMGLTQKEIEELTGISRKHVARLLDADAFLSELPENIRANIPLGHLAETAGLPKQERIKIIEAGLGGQRQIREFVAVVKKAEAYPEMREAIIAGKVRIEIAEKALEAAKSSIVEIGEESLLKLVGEIQQIQEYEVERMEAIIRGDITPTVFDQKLTPDQKRFVKFQRILEDLRRVSHSDIQLIEDQTMKQKAIELVIKIRDDAEAILQHLGVAAPVRKPDYLKP